MPALLSIANNFTTETIARLRMEIDDLIGQGGRITSLDIEPNRPKEGTNFAFVAKTPPATYRAGWYRCSYCECSFKFKRGILVLCADLRLRLIGEDCWRHHIAEEQWLVAKQDFRTYATKQRFQNVEEDLGRALHSLSRDLRIYLDRHGTALRGAEVFGGHLASHIPDLWKLLNAARRNQNELVVERLLTQREREIQGLAWNVTGNRSSASAGRRLVMLHRIQGIRMLGNFNVFSPLLRGLREIQDANIRFQRTSWDNLPHQSFARSVKALTTSINVCLEAIQAAVLLHNEVQAFFSEANIRGIRKWAEDHDAEIWLAGELRVASDKISLFSRDGTASIRLIDSDTVPPLPDHTALQRIVNHL